METETVEPDYPTASSSAEYHEGPSSIPPRFAPSPTPSSFSSSLSANDDPASLKAELQALKRELKHAKAHANSLEHKLSKSKASHAPFGSSVPTVGSHPSSPSHHSKPLPNDSDEGSSNGLNPNSRTNGYRRSPSPAQTLSRIPVSAVSLNRALVGGTSDAEVPINGPDGGGEHDAQHDDDPPGSPQDQFNPGDAAGKADPRNSGGNPFFGSGSAASARHRVNASAASAAGGTGRVITNLQTELVAARAAVESVKSQLRLSQRAVEFLTRQTEDLKDGRERLRLENEGLNKMVSRKERMLEETSERAKKAESSLTKEREERKKEVTEREKREKILVLERDEARERMARSEAEFQALKSGWDSINRGHREEVQKVREEVAGLTKKYGEELEDARLKNQTLAKLFQSRQTSHSSLTSTLDNLKTDRDVFVTQYSGQISSLVASIDKTVGSNDKQDNEVAEVRAELNRILRLIRNHRAEDSAT